MGRKAPEAIPMIEKETRKLKFPFLTVGSVVEVSSEEEGFKGAWYVAKILKSVINGKSKKFLIEYETLVCENDSNQLLIETVDGSFVRPPPPPTVPSQIYELGDVVDAFHSDGWWKGVVTKVYKRKFKRKLRRSYTVAFEDPPEQFKFNGNLLRFHHDWIAGRCVRSPKQKVLPNTIQSSKEEEEEEEQSCVKSSRKNPLEQSTSPSTSKKQRIAAPEIEENTFPNYSIKALSHDPIQQEAAAAEVINEQNVETFNHSSSTLTEQAERNNKNVPIMKTSYMWKHIDSLEIFRTLPQKPHFSYLSDCNEEFREGAAIGHMLTFASLLDKVTKLQIDDPTSLFDTYLEALDMLEEIGFDVKVVVDRVNDLLSLKTRQEH